jgi:hypothetical protein
MSSFSVFPGIIEVRYAKWDGPSSLILAYYDTSGQILMRGPLKHEIWTEPYIVWRNDHQTG